MSTVFTLNSNLLVKLLTNFVILDRFSQSWGSKTTMAVKKKYKIWNQTLMTSVSQDLQELSFDIKQIV